MRLHSIARPHANHFETFVDAFQVKTVSVNGIVVDRATVSVHWPRRSRMPLAIAVSVCVTGATFSNDRSVLQAGSNVDVALANVTFGMAHAGHVLSSYPEHPVPLATKFRGKFCE